MVSQFLTPDVLFCETGHIALRNGPFRRLKWPILEAKMARFTMR